MLYTHYDHYNGIPIFSVELYVHLISKQCFSLVVKNKYIKGLRSVFQTMHAFPIPQNHCHSK